MNETVASPPLFSFLSLFPILTAKWIDCGSPPLPSSRSRTDPPPLPLSFPSFSIPPSFLPLPSSLPSPSCARRREEEEERRALRPAGWLVRVIMSRPSVGRSLPPSPYLGWPLPPG